MAAKPPRVVAKRKAVISAATAAQHPGSGKCRAARAVAVQAKRSSRPPANAKLTKAGQHFPSSGLCIATTVKGTPCRCKVAADAVPYCKQHMQVGDASLRVVSHPLAGKILVARRDLPKGYRLALWGLAKQEKAVTEKEMEWAFHLSDGWMLDPTRCKGSLVQFCPCPGPNESAALGATGAQKRSGKYGSWVFALLHDVPKDWQMTMQYGSNTRDSDQFFQERGIQRLDVGTKDHPALRRKDAPPLPL